MKAFEVFESLVKSFRNAMKCQWNTCEILVKPYKTLVKSFKILVKPLWNLMKSLSNLGEILEDTLGAILVEIYKGTDFG